MEPDPVTDSRAFPRFVVLDPLPGHFAGTDITILYMAEGGMHLQHAVPLKVNARARVGFLLGDQSVSLPAIVVWSRLSKTRHEHGKPLYSSGIRLDDPQKRMIQVIEHLATLGRIRRDDQSLEQKRKKLAARDQARSAVPRVKIIGQPDFVPHDQLLLIQRAREYLRSNPGEALNWYNRVKYAVASEPAHLQEMNFPHREEVLAVWEYLERSVDLVTIARAFEMKQPL